MNPVGSTGVSSPMASSSAAATRSNVSSVVCVRRGLTLTVAPHKEEDVVGDVQRKSEREASESSVDLVPGSQENVAVRVRKVSDGSLASRARRTP